MQLTPTPEHCTVAINSPEQLSDMLILARQLESQRVIVVGSTHETNPMHPNFAVGTLAMNAWLAESFDKPNRIMVHEGRIRGFGDTIDETIRHHFGESGFIQYHGHRLDIENISGEPSLVEEVGEALTLYGAAHTSAFLGMRELPWCTKTKLAPRDYLEQQFWKYRSLIHPQQAYEMFIHAFHAHYGFDPDVESVNEYVLRDCLDISEKMDHPEPARTEWLARLHAIARHVQNARTRSFGRAVLERANEGKSVFAWFGMIHVKKLEPVIATFGSNCNPLKQPANDPPSWYTSKHE